MKIENNEVKDLYGFIYITTNMVNGKRYIGQKKIDKEGKWNNYLGSGVAFKKALDKYGNNNFYRDIVALAYSKDELDKLEIEWINNYNAVESRNFYNIVSGGGTVTGLKMSDETKKKLSVRFSGENNPMYGKGLKGEDNPFYGKHHTEESRKKMSDSHKGQVSWCKGRTNIYSKETLQKMREKKLGKPLSEEHKRNIRESQKGENHPMYGKHHTEETKKKISKANKGKVSHNKGKHLSDDTKAKISESNKGKRAKKVICITTNKIFNSVAEAQEHYKCIGVSLCCKGKRKSCGKSPDGIPLTWMYYEDYINNKDCIREKKESV